MMSCNEVLERLVPWHDGEVGPSEGELIAAHLASCPSCASWDRRLQATVPSRPALKPPPGIEARLDEAFDLDRLLARAEQPSAAPEGALGQARRLLSRRAEVPLGAVMVYMLLLVGSFAWGLSSWWALPSGGRPPVEAASADIPADQFMPASFEPRAAPEEEPGSEAP